VSESCSLVESERTGWRALTLRNGSVEVTVLPERGCELYEFRDRSTGVDVLFKSPWGLQPPGAAPREGSQGMEFLHNYGGGWQELLPSCNDACTYRGVQLPFHGEVATVPWDVTVSSEDGEAAELIGRVRCARTPFALERRMRLERGQQTLTLRERVENLSADAHHLVWGHHCVVGAPFLQAGCRLHAPARTIVTLPEAWEDTARLAPGQREPWPYALRKDGGRADLREVPGAESDSHDDVFLTDLDDGTIAVENPRLGRTFRLRFDHSLFRYLVAWQSYGGTHEFPLKGSYALGMEPWISLGNLEQAVEAGEAIELAGGASLETTLTATIEGGPAA
jgi:galactose mutarotase-like enzyme